MVRPSSLPGLLGLLLSVTACFTSSSPDQLEEAGADATTVATDDVADGDGAQGPGSSRQDASATPSDSGAAAAPPDPPAPPDEPGQSDAAIDAGGGTFEAGAGASPEPGDSGTGLPPPSDGNGSSTDHEVDAGAPDAPDTPEPGQGDGNLPNDAGPKGDDGTPPMDDGTPPMDSGLPDAPDPPGGDGASTRDSGVTVPPPQPDQADAGSPKPSTGPCAAPLPTGLCIDSDPDSYPGRGRSFKMTGAEVRLETTASPLMFLATKGSDQVRVTFAAPSGERLRVRTYPRAMRTPFRDPDSAGLEVSTNGSGCNRLEGSFEVTELRVDPDAGLVRFAATFEQRCEGQATGLRGAINFRARGVAEAPMTSVQTIALPETISRVAYDAEAHILYGIDRVYRSLCKIDLDTEEVSCVDVVQRPDDLCVDHARERLFIVNKGSSMITEHDSEELSLLREFAWNPVDTGSNSTHFQIHCTSDRLFLVDNASQPGLWTVEALDDAVPVVTNQTKRVSAVGGVVANDARTDLYTWQLSSNYLGTEVTRWTLPGLLRADRTDDAYNEGFTTEPLDAPLLLDETRGLIFAKNRVFDANNLLRTVYTLPGPRDYYGAQENTYAIDSAHGLLATKNYLYDIDTFRVISMTLAPEATQLFFDRDGRLRFLVPSRGELLAQEIKR